MELVVKRGAREAQVRLEPHGDGYRVEVDGQPYDVDVASTDGVLSLIVEGRQFVVAVRPRGNGRYWVSHAHGDGEVELMDPLTYLARQSHGSAGAHAQKVAAYMPGRVIQVLVEEGQSIEAGQGLVVLEAMKMENEIQAEQAGTVTRILVEAGQTVEGGDVMFEIGEPSAP